jgi:hypothetical protein
MDNTRVWARLDPEVHTYFFRQVLANDRGARQELTAEFFTELYHECLRREIPPRWSADARDLIREIMSNLNFNDETNRSRRAPYLPAQHQREPFGGGDDPGSPQQPSSQAPSPTLNENT